jgi:hypothetical protein
VENKTNATAKEWHAKPHQKHAAYTFSLSFLLQSKARRLSERQDLVKNAMPPSI